MRATCICGNTCSFDKETLKSSTIEVNGVDIVLCIDCENELLIKLSARRLIGIKLGDGGELRCIDVGALEHRRIKLADGYKIEEV